VDVRFEEFRLDSEARRLLRSGDDVHLSRKAYELLELLAASRPRVVSKAELQERLWPDTFVVEANLSNLVAEIRAALGDDPREPRFIRTVHGVGYAFSAEVSAAIAAEPHQPATDAFCHLVRGDLRIPLRDGEHLLGRHPASILKIDSNSVSRRHAAIRVAGELAVLRDLGSRNGTYLQGQRIDVPTALADGDVIRVGSVTFVFQLGSTEPPTADFDPSSVNG
jgi:DNA-binding winged helix-turn-helix (wHTH) protein